MDYLISVRGGYLRTRIRRPRVHIRAVKCNRLQSLLRVNKLNARFSDSLWAAPNWRTVNQWLNANFWTVNLMPVSARLTRNTANLVPVCWVAHVPR